jgi:hypothetical protein
VVVGYGTVKIQRFNRFGIFQLSEQIAAPTGGIASLAGRELPGITDSVEQR